MDLSVSGGIPNANFDWNALVDKINTTAPSADVRGATFDASKGNVTFTVGEGDAAREITIEVPDLDSPGAIDQTEFASLVAKLGAGNFLGLTEGQISELTRAYSEFAGVELPAPSGNTLFDIYTLMALMLEAAQHQRDAMREMRQAENEIIQNSIQAQADKQRSAALTGLIAGLVVASLQVAMQSFALAKSAMGHPKQMQAIRESGIGPAQKHMDVSKAAVETRSAELTQMKEIRMAQEGVDTAQAKVDATKPGTPEHTQAQSELKAAKQTLTEAKAEFKTMADKHVEAQQNRVGDANKRLETADKNVAKAEADLASAKTPAGKAEAQAKLDAAKIEQETAQVEFDHATSELATAKNTQTLATDVAAGKVAIGEGHIQAKEVQLTDATSNAQAAKEALNAAQANLNGDPNYVAGRYQQDKWQNLGQMFSSVGGMLQGVVRSATDLLQADVTEMSADQKKAEEERDQVVDLFKQGQDVVRAVLDLAKAVIQAESTSMRDAIQA